MLDDGENFAASLELALVPVTVVAGIRVTVLIRDEIHDFLLRVAMKAEIAGYEPQKAIVQAMQTVRRLDESYEEDPL